MADSNTITISIKGRSLVTGVPKEVEINQAQIAESLNEVITTIAEGVKTALENTPPELSSDIVDRGIVLTGGGALLKNLSKVIAEITGVPVCVAENPLNCVVLGTGYAIEDLKKWQNVLIKKY